MAILLMVISCLLRGLHKYIDPKLYEWQQIIIFENELIH